MATLGISSATKVISVGLAHEGRVLAEITISGKQAFSEDLMCYIDQIMKETPQCIGASLRSIAVVQGPGAYSGVRGGMAIAKTLAQVKKLPIVGVSTLESIAHNFIDSQGTYCVLTDARRQEYNFALFTIKERTITRLTEDLVYDLDKIKKLLDQVKGKLFLAGQADEFPKIIPSYPAGGQVAVMGEKLIAHGKAENYLKMSPKYSFKPNIREWKK